MLKDLILVNRSYRRFYQEITVDTGTLVELIDLARLSASGGNLQPLKYIISNNTERNELIFQCLSWAEYLKDRAKPEEGEKPAAYIIVLGDKDISHSFQIEAGIASQSILLGAAEKGLGGCIIASIDKVELQKKLNIPEKYEIILVLAIGKSKEKVIIEKVHNGNIKYWRDDMGFHHVPKRSLEEIIIC